ncbi:MAG: Y4bD/Y4pK family protein [Actinomycetota bacterium]|nr:Y4bD/Y4pK family protein [Actinomycetota bacterium]
MVTHPFHPLNGQRLEVLGRERRGGKPCLRCVGGPLGVVVVPAAWTDQCGGPAACRLTYEVLAELAAAVAAVRAC